MTYVTSFKRRSLLLAVTAALAISASTSTVADAKAPARGKAHATSGRRTAKVASLPVGTQRPSSEVLLSVGQGQLVTLPEAVSDVWTSNPEAADVYVNSPRQIYVFGKSFGEATIFATTKTGTVAYSTNVRVSQNITSIDRILKLAMPDADLKVTTAGQLAVLTGTVATPDDAAQADTLVRSYLNPGVDVTAPGAMLKIGVINRLKVATPLQVNLQVKIAEVNRSLVKEIGVNLLNRDTTGGFNFGIAQGRSFGTISNATLDPLRYPTLDASSVFGLPAGSLSLPFDTRTGQFVNSTGTAYNFSGLALGAGKTAIGLAGRLFGLDVGAALDLAEKEGLVSTLAQPNLTALSGETASFLAGGEIPIPIAQQQGTISVEYKQYGVSLSFTPTVLGDGRISMRVRPEVSDLSAIGTVRLNGFDIPGITTRRAETTVELGSGQSFMIGGLLSNSHSNTIDRAPGLGNVPVLGAMFRSTSFRKNETELVIIVTPYLVKPVSANQIALPTDGYKAPTDIERVLLGQTQSGKSGGERPKPSMAPPAQVVRPELGSLMPSQNAPSSKKAKGKEAQASYVSPGFGGN
jgi:pilus assembly protein CpaC